MSTTQRLILFLTLSMLILVGSQIVMRQLGLMPAPVPAAAPDDDADKPAVKVERNQGPLAFAGDPDSPPAFAPGFVPADATPEIVSKTPEVLEKVPALEDQKNTPLVPSSQLVLGADDPDSPYEMKVQLLQRGASVAGLTLADHEAEHVPGQPEGQRLKLIDPKPGTGAPPPFALTLLLPGEIEDEPPSKPFHLLETARWEVVRDDQGRAVTPLDADEKAGLLSGQQVTFRTQVPSVGLSILKTYQLRQGASGFEMGFDFQSDHPLKLAYRLEGPHGLPIEGEWYTSTFRDVFFGKISPGDGTELETHTASEVADADIAGNPLRITTLPLKFAGVENQYFAVFFEPSPLPETPNRRWDAVTEARAVDIRAEKQKSDVTVVSESKPFTIAPNAPVTRNYRVFAGPKDATLLAAYGADELSTYRKGWQLWIIGPLATLLAKSVIAPLLGAIYNLTTVVAGWMGFAHGNYGIAIILLTITVRLGLLPLSRKQALAAKKMQDMAPHMQALREKYKDDKEKLASETMGLYRKFNVSPFGGCLLALIQMPIFFGLWQALNNSVALRGSSFLWIDNLAAPDQLFHFPFEIPFLGEYFNLLPFVVVSLMLVHMKLFSPPASTPEQEMSQKMMKYMMVFMAFMFYRVPSGLGLYFITSSSWAIIERVWLPRHLKSNIPAYNPEDDSSRGGGNKGNKGGGPGGGGKGGGSGGNGSSPKPGGWRDRLQKKLEEVMEEASNKDKTYRKSDDRERDRNTRDRDRNRPRPKPGRRR